MSRVQRSTLGAAVAVLCLGLLVGCARTQLARSPTPGTAEPSATPVVVHAKPTSTPTPTRQERPRWHTALAAVASLPVQGRAPQTGYDRALFGQAWLDTNRNGCDTRNDILTRDLTVRVTRNCVVESGSLDDPYTGGRIAFVRGDRDLVDVDHVVALENAWVTGAFGWDIRKRAAFANDPLNLLAVDAGANRQKGDGDAATWLPSNKRYRCAYVARQVAVKRKYGLWATAPERAAISRILSGCPGARLPRDSGAPVLSPVAVNAPHPRNAPTRATGSAYYRNCDAARAAGAAPVRRGDPGYGPGLDRDGDGVACE